MRRKTQNNNDNMQKIITYASNNDTHRSITTKDEIENGLNFIISHFDPTILYFPRTITTHKLEHKQVTVFSKQEILSFFQQSNYIDCRINAFRFSSTSSERWNPDLVFIDIDRKNFKDDKSFESALSKTLKKIEEKLNGYPTVLFTGGGYHIYQPIEGVLFEDYDIFNEFHNDYDLFKEFLRFSKKFLSNDKADKNSNPSLKSCLLRIPGSINSKHNTKVTIVSKWNGYRPSITNEFLHAFRRHLIQKKIGDYNYGQRKKQNYSYSHMFGNRLTYYYEWIERILQTPFEDCRKIISSLILAPYLINVKKLPFQQCFQIIKEWLDKCNSLEKLYDLRSFSSRISYSLKNAKNKQIGPMSQHKIKIDYSNLYILLKKKGIFK